MSELHKRFHDHTSLKSIPYHLVQDLDSLQEVHKEIGCFAATASLKQRLKEITGSSTDFKIIFLLS